MFETISMFVLQACQVSSVHESLSSWMSVMFSSPAPVTVSRKSLAHVRLIRIRNLDLRFASVVILVSYRT
jgi:hypothetical protein